MATIRLLIDLEYDADIMYGGDSDAKRWFFNEVLKEDLTLHSNVLGDEIGRVTIISTKEETNEKS